MTEILRKVFSPPLVWRAGGVAGVVGTALCLINHFELFLGKPFTVTIAVQIGLTYLVPFAVSAHGQLIAAHKTR